MALMRLHRGSLERQSTLSAALVAAMGGASGESRVVRASMPSAPLGDHDSANSSEDDAMDASCGDAPEGALSGGCRLEEDGRRAGGGASKEVSGPLVAEPWYQLVLCRECMLHGFYGAAEAGLRRLRRGEYGGVGAATTTSDVVWVWTEVLTKISAAEAYFGGSSDQASMKLLFCFLCDFFCGPQHRPFFLS